MTDAEIRASRVAWLVLRGEITWRVERGTPSRLVLRQLWRTPWRAQRSEAA